MLLEKNPDFKRHKTLPSLICITCNVLIKELAQTKLSRHLKSKSHIMSKKLFISENKLRKLEKGSEILSKEFISNNIPLKNFDKENFKETLKELDVNLQSSKTVRRNLFIDISNTWPI